jgi:Rieske Fe-S protein
MGCLSTKAPRPLKCVNTQLIKGKFEILPRNVDDLSPGEGGVVTYEDERAGAYKDDEGKAFIVDTTCTHLGCETVWNEGDVVEGPAERTLKRLI